MWYYDEYFRKWFIDLHHEEKIPDKVSSCDNCQAIKDFGIDACCGCAG